MKNFWSSFACYLPWVGWESGWSGCQVSAAENVLSSQGEIQDFSPVLSSVPNRPTKIPDPRLLCLPVYTQLWNPARISRHKQTQHSCPSLHSPVTPNPDPPWSCQHNQTYCKTGELTYWLINALPSKIKSICTWKWPETSIHSSVISEPNPPHSPAVPYSRTLTNLLRSNTENTRSRNRLKLPESAKLLGSQDRFSELRMAKKPKLSFHESGGGEPLQHPHPHTDTTHTHIHTHRHTTHTHIQTHRQTTPHTHRPAHTDTSTYTHIYIHTHMHAHSLAHLHFHPPT